jgi:hypothetical protein
MFRSYILYRNIAHFTPLVLQKYGALFTAHCIFSVNVLKSTNLEGFLTNIFYFKKSHRKDPFVNTMAVKCPMCPHFQHCNG